MDWVKCPNCRHKFFKCDPGEQSENWVDVEIKCSSCKKIARILIIDKNILVNGRTIERDEKN